MKKFNTGNKRNDRSGFKPRFGDSQPVKLHSAVCATCHKDCDVPFRPNGDKPVYCRDCFAGRAAFGGERSNTRDMRGRGANGFEKKYDKKSDAGNTDLAKQIEALNSKVDKLMAKVDILVGGK